MWEGAGRKQIKEIGQSGAGVGLCVLLESLNFILQEGVGGSGSERWGGAL